MKNDTTRIGSNKSLEDIKKAVELDLKDFKKKRTFSNIAKLLNDDDLNNQINTVNQIIELYEAYPEEIDKITEMMVRSVVYNQKLLAISIITELSTLYPDFAFPKLANIIINQNDLIEIVSKTIKNLWKEKYEDFIKNIRTFWNPKNNKNLKLVAILSLDTSNISDSEIMLSFLSDFKDEPFPEIRHEIAMKLKDLYIKEPYVVESEMRKWLKETNSRNTIQIIIASFREISKRRDPFLLDRTCLIMENWSRNSVESISDTGKKILDILREKL